MALLNPPELRPSIQLLIVSDLARRRGERDKEDRLLAALAPKGLGGADPDRDVRVNIQSAVELGIMRREGDDLLLAPAMQAAARAGTAATTASLRKHVLDASRNVGEWGSQTGARDLTNALSWLLSFPAGRGPIQMEGGARSANTLQEKDFGPRQADRHDDDSGGWPIGNPTRWQSFRRWACSLGFAWIAPNGALVADPTSAIRDALPTIFERDGELPAHEFVARMAQELPVLDTGAYRRFVESHWQRSVEDDRLGEALTDALERLRASGHLMFDDRADAARVTRADRTTFSHVRTGRA